jgi:hypothetical protein
MPNREVWSPESSQKEGSETNLPMLGNMKQYPVSIRVSEEFNWDVLVDLEVPFGKRKFYSWHLSLSCLAKKTLILIKKKQIVLLLFSCVLQLS